MDGASLMENTVYQRFAKSALNNPHLPFLCYPSSPTRDYYPEGKEFSYGSILTIVDNLALRYLESGYSEGHRIALLAGNRAEHFFHLLALNRIGAAVVTLNPEYLSHELAYGISFPECSLVATVSPWIDKVKNEAESLLPTVGVIDVLNLPDKFPSPAHPPIKVPTEELDRPALIIYTSGTTGRPKGCIISNRSCLAAGDSYADAGGLLQFHAGVERLYIPLPAFHMNVSIYTLNSMTKLNSCIILQEKFSASTWWADIIESKATCFHYMGIIPPLLVKAAASEDDRRHNVKFGQGAGVDPLVREQFEERFGVPLVEAWGMTETSRAIQNCGIPRCLEPRAFGRPRLPLEVLVVDDDDKALPFNSPGELLIRAVGSDPRAGFFSGYLNLPEQTEDAWKGGWFHTGDVVSQREDGMLFFVDRRKNIIRRSGENIAATEIEEALIMSLAVQSVAALSVADEFHDEEVMVCVVLMPGYKSCKKVAESIMSDMKNLLAGFKLPAWIVFVESLPTTGTQKIQKNLIFPDGEDPRKDPRSYDVRLVKRRLRKEE